MTTSGRVLPNREGGLRKLARFVSFQVDYRVCSAARLIRLFDAALGSGMRGVTKDRRDHLRHRAGFGQQASGRFP